MTTSECEFPFAFRAPDCQRAISRVLAPAVLLPHLRLLFRSEIVHNIELLPDLLGVLAFDHGCDLGTSEVKQALDVEIVRCEDDLEKHFLLDVHKLGIPLRHSAL